MKDHVSTPIISKTAYIDVSIIPSYTITTFRRRLPSLLRSSPPPLLFLSLRLLKCNWYVELWFRVRFYGCVRGVVGVGVGVGVGRGVGVGCEGLRV